MLKALLKKQFLELTSFIYGGKEGKQRAPAKIILYLLLLIYAMGSIGAMVYLMMSSLCKPLIDGGYDWLYFSLSGILALFLGVFGSVFTTKSQLYDAKDNELLLSMPIKPSVLLLTRLSGIFSLSFIFEAVILVPTVIVYLQVTGITAIIPRMIGLMILLTIFTMVFTCLLGWLVALIASRLKNKSIATVLLSLAFLGVYFYFYSKMPEYLPMLLGNVGKISASVMVAGYPLYQFGLAATGNPLAFVIFAAISLGLFAVVYLVLTHSFLKIALPNGVSISTPKRAADIQKLTAGKVSPAGRALLKKEFRHLLASPVYMMNCALGTPLMLVAAVAMIIQRSKLSEMLASFGGMTFPIGLIMGAALCLMATMNNLTAPSISLEGRTLWQTKSLPISAESFFRSKIELQLILTLPPLLLCTLVAAFVLQMNLALTVAVMAAVVTYTLLCAYFGLFINLKLPNFNWKNEAIAVKQSASVIISLFVCWGFIFAAAGIYMLIGNSIGEAGTAIVSAILFFGGSLFIHRYLKKRGEYLLLAL